MRTVSQAWLDTAANAATRSQISASYHPIWLVEILGVNTCYTTQPVYFSRERQLGDGLVLGNGALLGGYLPSYGLDLAVGGLGAADASLTDDYTRTQVSGWRVALLNQEGLLRDLSSVLLDNAIVRLRLGFVGLGYDDFLEVWSGVVDRLEDRLETVNLECLDGSLTRYPTLSVPLSPQYFPATPQANKSRAIPLLLGRNTDVETIKISGAAQGTLAFAISSGATALLLKEFGAPFPASGSIQVGTETSITYSSRSYITNPTNGLTSLQLAGLVRSGTPASHAVGESVTLVNPNYDYLIGYRIADLQAVRAGGAITTSYTLLELQANAPVSVLRFTTAPAEPVTVDVNAGSVDDLNLLVNGGFETGNLTGYTTGAGATAAVGTSSPSPEEGTYRASLQGDEGVYKDLYQDVATVIGADYILRFSRHDEDSDLLVNGGFETGDLTGWTTSFTPNATLFAIVDAQEPSATPFGARSNILSRAADGRYALIVGPAPGYANYEFILSQDVATTIGNTYTVSLRHITFAILQSFSGHIGLSIIVEAFLRLSIGTTTNPMSIVADEQINNVLLWNGVGFLPNYVLSQPFPFVATATTTRLTIRCIGFGQVAGLFAGLPFPPALLLDAIRFQNTSVVDTSEVGYQIGTPADPDSIIAVSLDPTYVWTSEMARFRAIDGTTRLTWQSRHTTSAARTSYLDNMSLQRVYARGYNPVEQIRYILQTFLPQISIDEASFITAYDQLIQWSYGTVLFDPGDSLALLNRMAEQCGSLLVESTGGVLKLVVRNNARATSFGFNQSNIVQGSFSAVPESLDNVYTEFYIWFGARTGGSVAAADFAASTYCTPNDTTHPTGQALTVLCQAAAMNYRRTRRLDIYADFIQDIFTANLLLEHVVNTRTIRQTVVTFETWLDAAHLELGDVVAVEDPRYAGTSTLYDYEIVGVTTPTPEQPFPQITARSLRQSGWTSTFEYLAYAIETEGFYDDFES